MLLSDFENMSKPVTPITIKDQRYLLALAAKRAVQTAAASLRELRVAEVTELDMTVENGKVQAYRAKVKLSFKYEAAPTAVAPKKKAAKKKAAKKKKSRRR